jgi:SAM-dependent methyltransferase
VLGLSRLFNRGPLARYGARNTAQSGTVETLIEDRTATVPAYHALFSAFCDFTGQTVVELGCSRGYLLAEFLETAPFTAIGVDVDDQAMADGAARYGDKIRFVQSGVTSIPLPNASCDIAYTVDVVEHLADPSAIFGEIHRILRPAGRFLVYFHPWFGPYGAHLGDIIPFPWPHVFFSMDILHQAAHRLYDQAADSELAFYHIDPATGKRKPNPYDGRWRHYLNPDMTIRGFRRFLHTTPFTVRHFQRVGFGGKTARLARLARPLAQVPLLDEFFTSGVFCVLEKDGSAGTERGKLRTGSSRIGGAPRVKDERVT